MDTETFDLNERPICELYEPDEDTSNNKRWIDKLFGQSHRFANEEVLLII